MINFINNLNNSIMFNLSLSAKELFHSNLLGFLFKEDEDLFGKIVGNTSIKVKSVEREHKNIDIEVTDQNGDKYLIENKVKDIIDCSQLDKIENSTKDKKTNAPNYKDYILFSLLENNLSLLEKKYDDPGRDICWKEFGYKHIVDILKSHDFKDNTINIVKNDYCAFMDIMISEFLNDYSRFDKYLLFWDKSDPNNLLEKYKKVRMHDVIQKYGVSHFVGEFRKKCANPEIFSTYGFNRNGSMDFCIKRRCRHGSSNVDVDVGIQIENGKYRKSIIGETIHETFLKSTFEAIGWFDKSWTSSHGKLYLGYDHRDGTQRWYQVPDNVKNINYNDLYDKIKADIDNVSKELNSRGWTPQP